MCPGIIPVLIKRRNFVSNNIPAILLICFYQMKSQWHKYWRKNFFSKNN